jgi:hypothetical protein
MDQNSPLTPIATVGELTVLGSGLVHVNEGRNLSIKLDDITVEFTFPTDSSNESREARVEADVEGKKLILKLLNFTNSLGQGQITPSIMGSIRQKTLFLSYYVWTVDLSKGLRLISYNFYLGGPVDVPTAQSSTPAT